jgi:hypothetical protein
MNTETRFLVMDYQINFVLWDMNEPSNLDFVSYPHHKYKFSDVKISILKI